MANGNRKWRLGILLASVSLALPFRMEFRLEEEWHALSLVAADTAQAAETSVQRKDSEDDSEDDSSDSSSSDDGSSDSGESDGGSSDSGGSDDNGSDDGGSDDNGSDDSGSDDSGSDDNGLDDSGSSAPSGTAGSLSGKIPKAVSERADHVEDSHDFVKGELMASGLSRNDLARLSAKGYSVRTTTGTTLRKSTVALSAPKGVSVREAASEVAAISHSAVVAANDYYYADAGADKAPDRFLGASLVGWSPALSSRCGGLPPIGMVDTTVDTTHPDLAGASIETFENRKAKADPSDSGHGTAVASLLVGHRGGGAALLPDAHVIAVNTFFRDDSNKDRTDTAGLVQAIDYLVSRHVGVINLSLSGPPNAVLETAVAAAVEAGVVVVAAAGNGGPAAAPAYPAAYGEVIAVTAIDRKMKVYRQANQGSYVDLAAPGVNVWVAASGKGEQARSGTSFAAPFVTASVALMRAARPQLSPADVSGALASAARDLGAPGADPVFGAGLLQADQSCSTGSNTPDARIASAPPTGSDAAIRPAGGQ